MFGKIFGEEEPSRFYDLVAKTGMFDGIGVEYPGAHHAYCGETDAKAPLMDDAIDTVGEAANDGCCEFPRARNSIARQKFTRVGWVPGPDDGNACTVEQPDVSSVKEPQGPVGLR